MNPYDWQHHRPRIEIRRSEVEPLVDKLLRGKSGVLLAGRGMGKSVFLRQLAAVLGERDDVRVILLPAPPAPLTTEALMEKLAQSLGVEGRRPLQAHELVDAYFAGPGKASHLVLLYDELDRYGRPTSAAEAAPGREFFNNLEAMRRDAREVGILAAGSLGVFGFRDSLGSSFLARADAVRIPPFGLGEVSELAQPFGERGQPLGENVVQALLLASGGNPALLTYGLESLWDTTEPDEQDVAHVYARFQQENKEFLRDFKLSFTDPGLSEAPRRIWDLVKTSAGPISHAALEEACGRGPSEGTLQLDFADALDLLQAAGLVRVRGSWHVDPVDVQPVASLLGLPEKAEVEADLSSQLRRDLFVLLERIHSAGADFFRPGRGGEAKQLVPESVFAAYLALGFELLGWRVEREAQHGAGRTDLKLRFNGGNDLAVVELKIWGRPGDREVHRQVVGYCSSAVRAAAVVMLTGAEIEDWPEAYRRRCFDEAWTEEVLETPDASPVRALLRWSSTTADATAVAVDHFLLRVPR